MPHRQPHRKRRINQIDREDFFSDVASMLFNNLITLLASQFHGEAQRRIFTGNLVIRLIEILTVMSLF